MNKKFGVNPTGIEGTISKDNSINNTNTNSNIGNDQNVGSTIQNSNISLDNKDFENLIKLDDEIFEIENQLLDLKEIIQSHKEFKSIIEPFLDNELKNQLKEKNNYLERHNIEKQFYSKSRFIYQPNPYRIREYDITIMLLGNFLMLDGLDTKNNDLINIKNKQLKLIRNYMRKSELLNSLKNIKK